MSYYLICTPRTKPVSISVTECNWERQLSITKSVWFCQWMLGVSTIVERSHETLFSITAGTFSQVSSEEIFHESITVLLREAIHVILDKVCSQMIVTISRKHSSYVKRGS